MALIFKDPPESAHPQHRSKWGQIRAKLIANSGRWALVETFPQSSSTPVSVASHARNSKHGWEGHIWEAATAPVGRDVELYIRHVKAVA